MDPNEQENTAAADEPVQTDEHQELMAAMDAGISEADGRDDDSPDLEDAEPTPEGQDGDAQPEPEQEAEQEQTADEDAKAEVEAEADALGLKPGKSRERFHELTAQVREAAPVMEAIKAAGLAATDIPEIIQRANSHVEWVKHVVDTGASPEQYGMTLEYLADIGAAGRGDMAAAERAFEKVMGEAKALAAMLGKEMEGVYDPLEGHADLQQLVEDLSLTKEKAVEIARDRQTARALQQGREQQAQHESAKQAEQSGIDDLIRLDAAFRQQDPAYDQKRPYLDAMVATIRKTLPPSQWAAATQEAYSRIPTPQAPPPPANPPVGRVPMRGTGTHGRMQQQVFDDPMDALNAALSGGR